MGEEVENEPKAARKQEWQALPSSPQSRAARLGFQVLYVRP